MGMAASQARLLSITARLTNNENSGQSVSYSKQRLADKTQQITKEYNDALDTTKLTVLTGFTGAEANYTDISYNLMTGPEMAANSRQYVVTDTKGKVLVTEELAKAYQVSNGNFNQFLTKLGYSQSDMVVQNIETLSDTDKTKAAQKLHEAWDKYFATVGINLGDKEHDGFLEEFKWNNTWSTNNDGQYLDKNGNVIDTKGKTSEEIEKLLQDKGYSFVGSGYVSVVSLDEKGNPITQDGDWAYKTDDNGNYLDKDGNVIPKDEYSDEIIEKKLDSRYVNDKNEVLDYDVDTDGDGVSDTYSDEIRKHYQLKYVDENNKPIDYDKYSNSAIDKMVFDSSKAVYNPINYEGTTPESKDLYDYAMALTESFMRTEEANKNKDHNEFYDMGQFKSASDSENKAILSYYKNIFNKMQSAGFFTYTESPALAAKDNEHYKYANVGTGTAGNVQKSPIKDNISFEKALREGTLRLEYYSTTSKAFKTTTISEDTCIQEVADERAIAKAESKYNQDMVDLENKDKKMDLELKKLDTEHKALETEYESVKNVVNKNVEASFKTFG